MRPFCSGDRASLISIGHRVTRHDYQIFLSKRGSPCPRLSVRFYRSVPGAREVVAAVAEEEEEEEEDLDRVTNALCLFPSGL